MQPGVNGVVKPLETKVGAEALQPLRHLVGQALDDVRRLAHELRPSLLDDFGLLPALERLTQPTSHPDLTITLESTLPETTRLPPEHETALYRITQEALTNVLKHAHATHVHIRLNREPGSITLTITDNGTGYTKNDIDSNRLGLRGMQERATLLTGTLTTQSTPGQGTTVTATLPTPSQTTTSTP